MEPGLLSLASVKVESDRIGGGEFPLRRRILVPTTRRAFVPARTELRLLGRFWRTPSLTTSPPTRRSRFCCPLKYINPQIHTISVQCIVYIIKHVQERTSFTGTPGVFFLLLLVPPPPLPFSDSLIVTTGGETTAGLSCLLTARMLGLCGAENHNSSFVNPFRFVISSRTAMHS
jgi:hypothetical protein